MNLKMPLDVATQTDPIDPRVCAILNRPRTRQHTPEWYTARLTRVTASDVPAILGHNKYMSANAVFKKKTSQSSTKEYNAAMDHGLRFEAVAAKIYTAVTGIETIDEDIGLVLHPEYPQFGASPDRIAKDTPLLIEIKCPRTRKIVPGAVPDQYMDQLQFQLAVCDVDIVHFVEFKPPTLTQRGQLHIIECKRDPTWWVRNLPTLLKFQQDVADYWSERDIPIICTKPTTMLTVDADGKIVPETESSKAEFDFNPDDMRYMTSFTDPKEELKHYDVHLRRLA